MALFAVVPAILCSSWLVKTTLQRVRLEMLWSWSKEQGDRHIDCDESVHCNGVKKLRDCALAAMSPSLVATTSIEITAIVQSIIPVFVASSASTTYRAVVVTTQLSLTTLEFVSNTL